MADTNDALTGYQPSGFVAERLFPVVPVAKWRDSYSIWDGWDEGERHPVARVAEYACNEFAVEVRDDEPHVLHHAQDKILLDQEIRVMELATNPENYPSGSEVLLTGTAQWNDVKWNHTPFYQQVFAGINQIRKSTGGLIPNTMIVPFGVAQVLADVPGLEALRGHGATVLPHILNMRVVIPSTAAASSADAGILDLWRKHVILAYVAPKPSLDTLTFGLILRQQPWRVTDIGDSYNRVSVKETEVLVCGACGYLIRNVIA